jgi:glutaconate CoA-transferase, subunit A
MSANLICGIAELAAAVSDNTKLAIPKDPSGVAMAATRELVKREVRGLHLICVPVSGMQADILIGAGCVQSIETSGVSLGEFGPAPRFTEAMKRGTVRILDATCPAIYAGLQAAEKGIPFIPLRGIVGTDLLNHRTDWKLIDNPFQSGDKIVALPAIVPDVALFHAGLADRYGNVFIGRERELMLLAHAARSTLVSVEKIVDANLLDNEELAGCVIPSLYVTHVAEAPRGALPLGLAGRYGEDEATLAQYAVDAKTQAGFLAFVNRWCAAQPRHEQVLA